MALSLDVVKVVVLSALFIMTLAFGLLPLLLLRFIKQATSEQHLQQPKSNTYSSNTRRRHSSPDVATTRIARYKQAISFLSCFSAGVFLATCLLDLLPNVRHNFIKVLFEMSIYTGFPLAEFVMVVGLFLILIVEQIVLTFKESDTHGSSAESDRRPLLSESASVDFTESVDSLGGLSDEPCIQRPTNQNQQPEQKFETHSPLRAMLLVCALSLHSVFEGLTVGLQQTTADVLGIFAALVLHKSILSFSLGMNLVQSRISKKSAAQSVVLFSVASPVGIAIGIGIDSIWNSLSSGLLHGVLQGIASGTFLYIIFFEILPKEFNSREQRLLKVLFLILGYAAVTGILFLSDDTKNPFCVIKDSTNN